MEAPKAVAFYFCFLRPVTASFGTTRNIGADSAKTSGISGVKMSTRSPLKAPQLIVRRLSDTARRGVLTIANLRVPCTLGRSGIVALKREGDGATPRGRFTIEEVLFNPQRLRRPRTAFKSRPIDARDGWCDDPRDRNYNRPVRHPYPASAERLYRDDGLYDIVVVLSHNMRPRQRGRGSAIFMHVARKDFGPTEGCIALARGDLERILATLRRGTRIVTI